MNTLEIARELIRRASVTPDDAGCQSFIADLLKKHGFTIEHLRFGEVDNLWAVHGDSAPLFCFLGHTDVVPAGDISSWKHPPFEPTEENGLLYGRGAADMKGCIASFLSAAISFVEDNPRHAGSLSILLTSDEEGPGINGVAAVIKEFQKRGSKMDFCLVGEPSSEETVADVIKVGRRGSLNGKLQIKGVQGHVAYPHLARNPVHQAIPALAELSSRRWDEGNEFFPPTSFQISNVHAGSGAENVIPGTLDVDFNFRFSSELNDEKIRSQVAEILDSHDLDYSLAWRLSGQPFLTVSGRLLDCAVKAIEECEGRRPVLSTSGGTSDGRFVAPTGAEVAELGVINRSIHKTDEHVRIDDLFALSKIYRRILDLLLSPG